MKTAIASLLSAFVAIAAQSDAMAGPSLEETIRFTRAELTKLCDDRHRSRIEALDRLAVGGGRSCQIVLTPSKLSLSVRERGVDRSGRSYARMQLDVHFSRDSGFLCGRKGSDGMAPLFFTCQASEGANGPICAERNVEMDDPSREAFENTQMLAAASILRTDPDSCGTVARALSYIGARSKAARKDDLRKFFRPK